MRCWPAGSITYPYKWIMYDNENWAQTPTAEKNDPVTYMQDFTSACHAHGYKSIMAPGYDLFTTAKTKYPLQRSPADGDAVAMVRPGHRRDGRASAATCSCCRRVAARISRVFAELFNATATPRWRRSAPAALVFGEVSSSNATGATAAGPGRVDGH